MTCITKSKIFTLFILLFISSILVWCQNKENEENTSETKIKNIILSWSVKTNINWESISIADNVKLINLFNPDIIWKNNIDYSISHIVMKNWSTIPSRTVSNNEVQYYIKWSGKLEINWKVIKVTAWDSIFVPKNSKQKTVNDWTENLEFLSIIDPAWTPESEKRF